MRQSQLIKTIIIDDEMNAILLLEDMISKLEGVENAGHGTDIKSGLEMILETRPDIVFLDVRLKDERGFDLVKALKDYDLNPVIVIVTGYDQYGLPAIKAGAFDYILKPVDPDELQLVISRYRQKKRQLLQ